MESITPRMKLPKSDKKVIAVGEFPAEYRDIYPDLTWYRYCYAEFMQALRAEEYDLAVIGTCNNEALKFRDRPKDRTVVCYQPSVYLDLKTREKKLSANRDSKWSFDHQETRPPNPPGPGGRRVLRLQQPALVTQNTSRRGRMADGTLSSATAGSPRRSCSGEVFELMKESGGRTQGK